MSARHPKCSNLEHTDVPIRGGNRVRCTTCGDQYPCGHKCDHIACQLARGEQLDWITVTEIK